MSDNYQLFKSYVNTYFDNRDDEAYISVVDEIINNAQKEIERLNWDCMEKRQYVSTSDSYITYPTRLKEILWLKINIAGVYTPLAKLTLKKLLLLWNDTTSTSRPKAYGLQPATSEILVAPAPDQSYLFELGFIQRSADLDNDEDTSFWISTGEDVFLPLVLMRIVDNLGLTDDKRYDKWEKTYETNLLKLAQSENRAVVPQTQEED